LSRHDERDIGDAAANKLRDLLLRLAERPTQINLDMQQSGAIEVDGVDERFDAGHVGCRLVGREERELERGRVGRGREWKEEAPAVAATRAARPATTPALAKADKNKNVGVRMKASRSVTRGVAISDLIKSGYLAIVAVRYALSTRARLPTR
jgi:hypothetical protein